MEAMDYVFAAMAAYIASGGICFSFISTERIVDQPEAVRRGKLTTCVLLWPLLNVQSAPTPRFIIERAALATFNASWPKTIFILALTALPTFVPFFLIYLYLRYIDINIWLFWGVAPVITILSMVPFINILVFFLFTIFGLMISLAWLLWMPIVLIFLPNKKS